MNMNIRKVMIISSLFYLSFISIASANFHIEYEKPISSLKIISCHELIGNSFRKKPVYTGNTHGISTKEFNDNIILMNNFMEKDSFGSSTEYQSRIGKFCMGNNSPKVCFLLRGMYKNWDELVKVAAEQRLYFQKQKDVIARRVRALEFSCTMNWKPRSLWSQDKTGAVVSRLLNQFGFGCEDEKASKFQKEINELLKGCINGKDFATEERVNWRQDGGALQEKIHHPEEGLQ